MNDNKRIAINTAAIYFRLILTVGITLFSTRYVLEALGAVDFGLYNVIAGVVALFSFIAGTMATTTQRFISFTMGLTHSVEKIKEVFGSSLLLHLIVAAIVAIVVLLGGWLIIDQLLEIPPGKYDDAYFVLISVACGLLGTIISVPFEAVLMAHENIIFVSACQVSNAVIKLGGAYLLLFLDIDRLRVYAVIMACLPLLLLLMEGSFCLKKYQETHLQRKDLKTGPIMREIGKFASWVMIGTTCGTLRTQGVSILLNMFWGVIVNAANGVAMQVNSTLMFFSASITTSIRPQLVKSAGENDVARMNTLIIACCKYPLLLIALFGVPLIVGMPLVLSIWLTEVPDYTVIFCRLLIISTLFNQATIGLTAGMEACGKVKWVHLLVGLSFLLVLPAGYILAKGGCPPQGLLWCIVANEAFASILRILLAWKTINLDIRSFTKDVIVRCFSVIALLLIATYFIWGSLPSSFPWFMVLCLIDIALFGIFTVTIGLTCHERNRILVAIKSKIKI